jgi:tRNA (guanosine-2'-O-)-methyltransferase
VHRDDEDVIGLKRAASALEDRFWRRLTLRGWSPQGVVDVLEPLVHDRRRERLQAVTDQRLESVVVVLDAPHDPHNGAAVMRSCDAFGVQHLHVVERLERLLISRKVAQGTERWVEVHRHRDAQSAVKAIESGHFELVVTDPCGDLEPEDLAKLPRLALVFGNERDGVCPELRQAARHSVRVPMRGYVESLNLSVSAGILLRAATRGRLGDLPQKARTFLYARGLIRTVSRAADVLAASEPR